MTNTIQSKISIHGLLESTHVQYLGAGLGFAASLRFGSHKTGKVEVTIFYDDPAQLRRMFKKLAKKIDETTLDELADKLKVDHA
jgi:hypothetical protein